MQRITRLYEPYRNGGIDYQCRESESGHQYSEAKPCPFEPPGVSTLLLVHFALKLELFCSHFKYFICDIW